MTTFEHMWRKRWQEDMSQIARALDLDPETIPEDDGRDAILNAIARVRRDAKAEAWDEGHAACDRDWTFTADLSTPDEDREPWTNPYRETGGQA